MAKPIDTERRQKIVQYVMSHGKARVAELLVKFDLPISYKVPNASSFYEVFFLDKKAENSAIKFILPRGIGDYEIRKDVPRELVMDVLREFE